MGMNTSTAVLQQHHVAVPHFSEGGTALTASERAATADRKGLCRFCGIKTHKVAFPLRRVALTNDNVYDGNCIRCHHWNDNKEGEEEKIPLHVYAEWEQRNPGLSLPTRPLPRATARISHKAISRTHSPVPPLRNSQTSLTSVTSHTSSSPPRTQVSANKGHRRYNSLGTQATVSTSASYASVRYSTGKVNLSGSCSNQDVFAQAMQQMDMSFSSSHNPPPSVRNSQITVMDMSVTSIGEEEIEYTPEEQEEEIVYTPDNDDLSTKSPGPFSTQQKPERRRSQSFPTPPQKTKPKIKRRHTFQEKPCFDWEAHATTGTGTGFDWKAHAKHTKRQSSVMNHQLNLELVADWLNADSLQQQIGDSSIEISGEEESDIVERILSTMTLNKCNQKTQRNGCFLLQVLSSSTTLQVNSSKVCDTLLSTLKCNFTDPQVVQYASLTIYNILQQDPKDWSKAATCLPAVDVLLSSLDKYCGQTTDVQVARAICMVLHQILLGLLDSPTLALDSLEAKKAKFVASIHSALQTYNDDPLLQQHACGILYALFQLLPSEENNSLPLPQGLLDLIGRTVDRYGSDLDVLQQAMGALFYCTTIDNDATPALVLSVMGGMAKHLAAANIQRFGCGILRNLAIRKSLVTSIVETEGIQAIVLAMRTHSTDCELQSFACRTLKRLATNEQYELAIQQQGGINAVAAAIQAHPLDAALQEEAFGALVNLSLLKDNRKALVKVPHLTTLLVAAMKKHKRNGVIQQRVLGVLLNISISVSLASSFNEQGGIPLVVSAMQLHGSDVKIQHNATGSLQNLGMSNSCQASFGPCGAYPAIVNCMKAFGGNLKVQLHAIGCLKNAASQKENSILVSQAGGIHATLAAMKKHQHNANIQQEGCMALMHLSRVKDIGVAIGLNGGTGCAIAAMQQHVHSAGVQNAGCGLLWNLSTTKSSQKLIATEKGVDAILKAIVNHSKVLDVNQKACLALCNLASNEDCCVAMEYGCAIETVLDALRNHPSDAHLHKYACKFLYLMLSRSKTVDVLAENGGLPVIKATLERHGPENADLKKYATKLVDKIQRRLR